MITALLTGAAGAAVGAVSGRWARHSLAALGYRLDDEQDLPTPGPRGWIIWMSALSLGSIAAWLTATGTWTLAPVLLPLAISGPALAAIDLDVMRLPNRILSPAAVLTVIGLASTTITRGGWWTTAWGLIGGLIAGVAFWVLHVLSHGGLALGDVKLAAVIGLSAGAVSLATVWWALTIAALAALVWALAAHRRGPLAYGPWLLLGFWASVLTVGV
jgi:leader peptidase (prepilin peptidase)/N-methyltransferase